MAHTYNSSLKPVASKYIELLGANVTSTSIKTSVEENSYYPSLYSISEAFSRYNIDNEAFKIPNEEFMNYEIPTPFVAFISDRKAGQDFVLVTKMDDKNLTYTYGDGKEKTISVASFLDGSGDLYFKEIVWTAKLNEHSGEHDYAQKLNAEQANKRKQIASIAFVALAIIAALFVHTTADNMVALLGISLIKVLGLATTVLLLVYEIDKSHAFVKNICSLNKKTDCDAVLSSKAAKIGNWNWSEIGFFYFASTTIGLLFSGIDLETKVAFIAIANCLAAPYIVFSIYYQWRVAKQWCPMCLVIQAVLAGELIWGLVNVWPSLSLATFTEISAQDMIVATFCLFTPIAVWTVLKPILFKAKDHDTYLAAYKRLQYNPDIFEQLLKSRSKAPEGWQNLGILVGNPNAQNTILKICSPSCGPCSAMHPKLEEVIQNNHNVNLRIIFTTKNDEKDSRKAITCHLMAIAAQGNPEVTTQALDDWYLGKDKKYETFAARYPLPQEQIDAQAPKLEAMSKWCEDAHIFATPTLFINEHEMPENYDVEEMQFIL